MQSMKTEDGNILTEEEDVKNRWIESYQELYNIENPYNIDILKSIPKCTNSEEEPCILREAVAVWSNSKREKPPDMTQSLQKN